MRNRQKACSRSCEKAEVMSPISVGHTWCVWMVKYASAVHNTFRIKRGAGFPLRKFVDYHLDEIAAHLKQDLLHLVRVYLHAKGYEVKHCFVLQDRWSVENTLVVQWGWVLEHFKDYMPRLMHFGELNQLLVWKSEYVLVELAGSSIISYSLLVAWGDVQLLNQS